MINMNIVFKIHQVSFTIQNLQEQHWRPNEIIKISHQLWFAH